MKNLQISELNRVNLPLEVPYLESLVYVNHAIFYTEDDKIYYCRDNQAVVQQLCEDENCVTELTYLFTLDQVWFGTGNDFVYINTATLDVRIVGALASFITACWSPNREFVAVCESDGTIKLYKNCYNNPTIHAEYNNNEEPLAQNLRYLRPQITWKGDSEYFCVSYYDGQYKICICDISEEAPLQTISFPNMLPCVTWICNMIVCARRDDEGTYRICMYERNSLFHMEFKLDTEVTYVHKIKWNETCDVIGVHVTSLEGSFLNIYTHFNFKYQLKQQLLFRKDNQLKTFEFFPGTGYIINLIVTTTKSIWFYKFTLEMQYGTLPNGRGFYADIEGSLLNLQRIDGDSLTGRCEPIQILDCENPINTVAFHHTFSKCLIVDSHSNFSIYSFEVDGLALECQLLVSDEEQHAVVHSYNFCFTTEDTILVCYLQPDNMQGLYQFKLFEIQMLPKPFEEYIQRIKYIPELGKVLQLRSNHVVYLDDVAHLEPFDYDIQKLDYVLVDDSLYIIMLDMTGQLHINNIIVCSGVSSFVVHERYSFITAFVNKLYCMHLTGANIMEICNKSLSNTAVYFRTCEDGSTLLCGVPNTKHVLLHHPRGNTEIILCRNVALDQVEMLVKQKQWIRAFEFLRIERLDLNLLIDINPNEFMEHIEEFIRTVDKPNLLQSLLISLSDTNVLTTTYRDVYYPNVVIIKNKKFLICQKLLEVISDNLERYIKVAVLAAYAVGGVNSSMEVLHQLYVTYGDAENMIADGINCINLYVYIDDIRRACLSKVDIDFAECVFEKMNFDPKMHQSLFAEVRAQGSNLSRKHFIIHDHIDNFIEAMEYLVIGCVEQRIADENYDEEVGIAEMVEYAQDHSIIPELYRHCLKHRLFNRYIVTLYTDVLHSSDRHEESALIFAANGMWQEALESYVHCRLWNEALHALTHLDIDRNEYIKTLAKSLHIHGNYKDAAYLYRHYLNEPELAINSLINGRFYKEAIQTCAECNMHHIIESTIQPDYTAYYNAILEKIQTSMEKLKDYCARLEVLRQAEIAKLINPEKAVQSFEDYAESLAFSLRSITSTSRSRSIMTLSSRSRREERKKQDLRLGGTYENIALMRALHSLIREGYDLCPDIKYLCTLLMAHEPDGFTMAKILQDAHRDFLELIDLNVDIIWPPLLNSVNIPETPALKAIRKNLDDLDIKFRYPPEKNTLKWMLDVLDELIPPGPSRIF